MLSLEDNKWYNYGDKNFFDTGCIILRESENEFRIITCVYDADNENNYLLQDGTIDITDEWIDKEDVCKYAGLGYISFNSNDEEKARFANAVLNYYGGHTGCHQQWMTKNEVIDYINSKTDIEDDEDLYDFFINNFNEENRNVVVRVYSKYGFDSEHVFDNIEDAMEYFLEEVRKGDTLEIVDI